MKRPVKLTYAAGLLLAVLCSLILASRPRRVSWPVPPNNAYETFLQAANSLPPESPDYDNPTALAAFVSERTEAYDLVQRGLSEPCLVPVKASKDWATQHFERDLPRLKQLTHAMIARARHAEFEGQPEVACDTYLAAFRFAEATSRGGLSPDVMNSVACRGLVLRHCQSLLPLLMPQRLAEFATVIRQGRTEREAPSSVLKRTTRWRRLTFGFGYWWGLLREMQKTRSWDPLAGERSILAGTQAAYEQREEQRFLDACEAVLEVEHGMDLRELQGFR